MLTAAQDSRPHCSPSSIQIPQVNPSLPLPRSQKNLTYSTPALSLSRERKLEGEEEPAAPKRKAGDNN
jgi:hypothetical protein